MPLPRSIARFNRHATNRLLGPLAPYLPGFGVVVHHGRRSGRAYRTPVNVFRRPGGFVVALTYGPTADWVRNVLAEGGCLLETRGRRLRLTRPRLVHDERRLLVPAPLRALGRLSGVADFLDLSLDARAGRSASERVPAWVPFFNPVARRLLAAGLPMGPNALITVRGRTTGRPHTTPVTIVEFSGRWWVTAPFGEVDWVRNLRAAGRATITQRRRSRDVTAVELGPAQAVAFFRDVFAPRVRRTTWLGAWIVRHVDQIDIDNPEDAARGRPVFELQPVDR